MKLERIFWGIFFILGAVFIIAGKLGFMQNVGIWSLILTVFLAAVLIKSILKIKFMGIFLSLALLAIVYAEPLQIQAITPWPVLGAGVLLGIGCTLIFPKKHGKKWKDRIKVEYNGDGEERVINETDGSDCSCSAHFGSSIKYINSDEFVSAYLEANFGEIKAYFDNAIMKGTEASVNIDNNFAGMELYVPKTWRVVNKLDSAFGGVDEKGHSAPDGVHTLYLHGDNNFGGITIIYI